MFSTRKSILVVDDHTILRSTLSIIFSKSGYHVRTAQDGFSALSEIRREAPDVLLSDLNMPGMSGFELLSVVRRRFPRIRVAAMSGAFDSDAVPAGVAADAFYRKGTGIAPLLRLLHDLTENVQPFERQSSVPIWVSKTRINRFDDACVVITCPECLRVFPQLMDDMNFPSTETSCMHCASTVLFALVQTALETDRTGVGLALAS